jgi:hypothetical protein
LGDRKAVFYAYCISKEQRPFAQKTNPFANSACHFHFTHFSLRIEIRKMATVFRKLALQLSPDLSRLQMHPITVIYEKVLQVPAIIRCIF